MATWADSSMACGGPADRPRFPAARPPNHRSQFARMIDSHEIQFRVRYQETDGQGHVHHANFIKWFEMGRVELLRAAGHSYAGMEASGLRLVMVEVGVKYVRPAYFDDLLTLRTRTIRARGVRIEHSYEVVRDEELLAVGRTVVANVDTDGKPLRLPAWLQDR